MVRPFPTSTSTGNRQGLWKLRNGDSAPWVKASTSAANRHAGGVLGGISSGQDIVTRIALKPTSSLTTPGRTVDIDGNETKVVTKGRHDPCVGIRATPIAEAMVAFVLIDHLLRHRGQVGPP